MQIENVSNFRKNCSRELVTLNKTHEKYFIEVEQRIYDFAGKIQHENQIEDYYRKYIQLYYNLKHFTDYLVHKYSPSELIHLDSINLNPKFKQELENNQQQNIKFKNIQELNFSDDKETEEKEKEEEEEEEENNEGYLRCPKCKQTKNISTMQRQLRGADEPMSSFHTCQNLCKNGNGKCGYHWRVG